MLFILVWWAVVVFLAGLLARWAGLCILSAWWTIHPTKPPRVGEILFDPPRSRR